MEIDHPTLQLLFNVVMITGVTSLAAFCYLLRRANKQLTAELNQRQGSERKFVDYGVTVGSALDTVSQRPNAPPPVRQDIREFVANRSRKWKAPSTGAKDR